MSKNKYYSVNRYWTVCDTVVVKAKNKEEANELAMEEELPSYAEYVPDSITNDPSVDITEFKVIDGGKKRFSQKFLEKNPEINEIV